MIDQYQSELLSKSFEKKGIAPKMLFKIEKQPTINQISNIKQVEDDHQSEWIKSNRINSLIPEIDHSNIISQDESSATAQGNHSLIMN